MFKLGRASIDITPPIGCALAGGAFGNAVSITMPLEAHVLCLESDDLRVLLISCDLLGFDSATACDLRRRLASLAGCRSDAVCLAGTHTHNGPVTLQLHGWGETDPAYLAQLNEKLGTAVSHACSDFVEVTPSYGTGAETSMQKTRSSYSDGLDENIDVIRFHDQHDRPVAVMLSFACHPVCMHGCTTIDPDYPGRFRRQLRDMTGNPNLAALFFLGACGDVNPTVFKFGRKAPAKQAQEADAMARQLAQTALKCDTTRLEDGLSVTEQRVMLPVQPLPSEETRKQLLDEIQQRRSAAADDTWKAAACDIEEHWLRNLDSANTERGITVQRIGIGGIAVLAMSCELFATYGRSIRTRCPVPVFLATLANGYDGYVTTPGAVEHATYEAAFVPKMLRTNSFAPDVGERLVDEILGTRNQDHLTRIDSFPTGTGGSWLPKR